MILTSNKSSSPALEAQDPVIGAETISQNNVRGNAGKETGWFQPGQLHPRNVCFCAFWYPDSIGRCAIAEVVAKATLGKMAATSSADSDSGRTER